MTGFGPVSSAAELLFDLVYWFSYLLFDVGH